MLTSLFSSLFFDKHHKDLLHVMDVLMKPEVQCCYCCGCLPVALFGFVDLHLLPPPLPLGCWAWGTLLSLNFFNCPLKDTTETKLWLVMEFL